MDLIFVKPLFGHIKPLLPAKKPSASKTDAEG
jgi:hypothetical protein